MQQNVHPGDLQLLNDLAYAIATGMYSGIIVMKYAEFRALRDEAARLLVKGLPAKQCAHELSNIALSLARLGHKASSKYLIQIARSYGNLTNETVPIINGDEILLPTIDEAVNLINASNKLKERVFKLRPSLWFILRPWP